MALHQVLAAIPVLHIIITYLEPLLNCQRRFKSSGVAVTLGLTVTENNIKKVQKQDLKNIKNVKRRRDGMPKSRQTR